MDPITLIVSALAAGAAAPGGGVATQVIQDAYNGLKALIGRKFGSKGDVQMALANLESKPESESRKGVLAEELQATGAGEDQEAIALARKLLDLVGSAGPRYTATLTGSGAIAQTSGGVAAGEGGIAISGNVFGSIRLLGRPIPVPAQMYFCPRGCDEVWYKQFEGEKVPFCKEHGVPLIPTQPDEVGGLTPETELATLQAQIDMRQRLLIALENQRVLADDAEAARLAVQVAQVKEEIGQLEQRRAA